MSLSILNIGGHPKDVILYAGGTMAVHAAKGDRVCALTPTHGLVSSRTGVGRVQTGPEDRRGVPD